MDKKLLVSLMMTAPVASMFAANWETTGNGVLDYVISPAVNTENWKANGAGQFDDTTVPGSIVCPVSAGYLTHNQTLAVGKYSIAYGTMENAILKINNVWQAKKVNGKYVGIDGKALKDQTDYTKMVPEFPSSIDLSKSGALTVMAYPVDNSRNFTVGKITLTLQDVNFATIKNDLQTRLDNIVPVAINKDDKRTEAAALRKEYNTIQNVKRTAIQDDIDTIDLEDADALFSAYSNLNLNLWNVTTSKANDEVSKAIKSFDTTVTAYNKKAEAENLAWENTVKNTEALNALNQEVIDLRAELNLKQTEIDTRLLNEPEAGQLGEYCKFITAEDIAAAKAEIDKYQADIDAAYADLTKTVNFPSKKTTISDQIAAISYDTAIDDWKAYSKFLSNVLPQVNDFYGKIFALVNDTKIALNPEYDHAPVANVYDDTIYQVNLKLAEYFKQNKEYVINQEGGLTPNNKNIAGAAKVYDDVVADANERMEKMQAKYDETLNPDTDSMLVKQEAQWKNANEIISEYQAELDAKLEVAKSDAFKELKPADQTKINNDIKAIQNALDALENEAVIEYLAHNLDVNGAGFTGKTGKVDEANTKYDNDAQSLGGVLGLIADFNEAKAYVKKETNAKDLQEYNLYNVFNTAFNNIDAAIKTYYNDKKGTVADINESISNIKSMCDDLVGAYNTVLDQVADANAALGKFNTAITNKQVVKLGDKVAYVKSAFTYDVELNGEEVSYGYQDFVDAIAGYKAKLKEIAANAGNPMEAYDAAIAEGKVIEKDNYAKVIADAQQAFIEEVSEANLAFVQDIADDINEKKNEAPYNTAVGMDKVSTKLVLDKNYKGAKNVEEAADNVAAANGNAGKLATCDSDLQVLAEAYNKVYGEIQKVVDNYDAKVALDRVANTVQNAINSFRADINEDTVAPATIYYGKRADNFQTQLDNLIREITNAYNASTAADNEKNITGKLNTLKTAIGDEGDLMRENQQYYDAQVDAADNLATFANGLIDYITNNDDVVNPSVANNKQAYLDRINEILNDLADLNVRLTKDFGNGDSKKNDPTYQEEFDSIQKELNDIKVAENNNYLNAVKDSNNLWFKDNYLGSNVLTDQYNAAIKSVNEYRYNLTNADYYNALMSNEKFRENHQTLQQCYKRIEVLNNQFNKYNNALYKSADRNDWIVLDGTNTPAVLDGVKYADISKEANDIHQLIIDTLQNINDAAQSVADDFYNFNGAIANSLWNMYDRGSIYNILVAAGLTDNSYDKAGKLVYGEAYNQIKDQLTTFAAIENTYAALMKAVDEKKTDAVHAYVLGMDGIANQFIKLLPNPYADRADNNKVKAYADNIVLNAVNNQWRADYNSAVNTIKGWQTEMGAFTDDTDLTSHLQAVSNALTSVDNLNNKWNRLKNDTETRSNNFNQYDNVDLENALNAAKTAYEASKNANDVNKFNKDARETLLTGPNSVLKQTNADLAALLAWSGYHADQLTTVNNLQNRINSTEASTKRALNVAQKVDVDALTVPFTEIQNDIEDAYESVYVDEVEYAQSLLMLANSAFNDAKVKYDAEVGGQQPREAVPDLEAYDAKIKEYRDALYDLLYAYDAETRDELKAQVIAIEDELCDIINHLEQYSKPFDDSQFGEPTYNDTLDALDAQNSKLETEFTNLLNEINTKGEAADTEYGKYGTEVKDEYAPKVEDAIKDIKAYNEAYNAAGVDVIADSDKYTYLMNELEKSVNAIKAEWTTAQAKADKYAASDNLYDTLVAGLDVLKADTDYARAQVEKYIKYYDPCEYLYQNLKLQFEGQEENEEEGKVAIPSLYDELEDLRDAHEVTDASNPIPSWLENYVNSYVRQDLEKAAAAFRNATDGYGYDLINGTNWNDFVQSDITGLNNLGNNEKGWKKFLLNADETIQNVFNEIYAVDDVNTSIVNGYSYVENKVDKYHTNTTEEAKAAYAKVNGDIQTIFDKMKEIYDNAMSEDLFIKGDVANPKDGDVNILDVQALIDLIGEGVELEGIDKAIADTNDDNLVTVADVTTLIRYMMDKNKGNSTIYNKIRAFLPASAGSNMYKVEEVQGENGMRRFAVLLTNGVNFAAGQLDIKLPSHARVAGVSLGERASALDTYVFENDGYTRVIMTSLENDMIDGNNGCVLFIDVDGDAEIAVENVIFSDANGKSYNVAGAEGTGVDFINGVKDGVKAIYNAAGQKLNKLTKGVNIIRNADGTTTKKMGK